MMLEYVYTNYHESAKTAVVNTLSQAPIEKLFTAHLAKVPLDQTPGGQRNTPCDWSPEQRKYLLSSSTVLTTIQKVASLQKTPKA